MSFDEYLQRTLDTFSGQLREEIARRVREVGDELADAARMTLAEPDRPGGVAADTSAHSAEVAGSPLTEALRKIDCARSLTGVLDTLVTCAAEAAPRVGVWLVRGEVFQSWRFLGFDPPPDAAGTLEVVQGEAGIVEEAVRTASVAVASVNGAGRSPSSAGLPPGPACIAVPMALAGEVVAVLYADAGGEADAAGLDAERIEVLGRYAARSLESLTAIKAARWLTDSVTRPDSETGARDDDSGDEYGAARRYARLLVSEITLYHEPQVLAGRRERDLAIRLGGEIARARSLYDQRVPDLVRRRVDYLNEELVRILAEGDASLLELKG